MITKVRGTQDLLDLKLRNFVLNQAKKHLENYNYSQIQTPILEQTKLFTHSLGTTSDVVSKEMYIFDSDKKDSICLRPEATASTMRAYLENHIEQKPWKVFSYGSMFRRERPQKGRWREFAQFNIEAINTNSIYLDAYFIQMIDSFFSQHLKLEDYVLKLNFLGCSQDRKKHREELDAYLESVKSDLCETCLVRKEKNILRIFDCKNEKCKTICKDAPKLTDHLCNECKSEWEKLQEILQMLSVSFIQDPFLVRGLDYYNKTVFEFSSNELGAQDSFCGGGRYDLAKSLEAKKECPSIGCAMGLGRLLMLVEKHQDKLNITQEPALNLILPMGEELQTLALLLANELQANKLCADVLLDNSSMTNMMRKANKIGAKFVLILGSEEQQNGTVTIKNMQTGKSETVKQTHAQEYIRAN